ncbi:MAG: phosphohistidine phosphatase SixA [Nitrospirota bacterium]
MLIYLVQHADAKKEEEDPSRPLSEKGLKDIEKVASYVSKLNIKVHKIFHSTKLRAMQTAEVLSENLKPAIGISEVDGLAPLDDPRIWAERLKDIPIDDVIIVGHLPHLAKLSSLLLCGNAEKDIVSFKMAGIVCLKRDDTAAWSVQWMLTPEIMI